MKEVKQIAKTCHEINRLFCRAHGDDTQELWEDAPLWQKESAIHGVEFHLKNKDSKPWDSHNSWMKEKKDKGWVYGETKDSDKKEHPCMVKYEDLPVSQQAKDMLFLTIVRSFE